LSTTPAQITALKDTVTKLAGTPAQIAATQTQVTSLQDSVTKLPTSNTVTLLELSVYAITGMGTGDPSSEIKLSLPAALIPLANLSAVDLAKKNAVYTMSMRIKMTNINSNWRNIFYYGVSDTPYDRSPGVWQVPNSTAIHFRHQSTQDSNTGFDAIPLAALNTWYHLVVSCDGSVMHAYVNGVLSQTVTLNANQHFKWGNTIPQKQNRMRIKDNGYAQASGIQVNDIYMLPIAMTAADVATMYSTMYV